MGLLIWSVFYQKFHGIHFERSKQLLSTRTYFTMIYVGMFWSQINFLLFRPDTPTGHFVH